MSTSPTQQKMLQARDLIQAKRYSEARAILESVDHPKAKEWLDKLDMAELGDPFEGAKSSAAQSGLEWQIILGIVVAVVIVALAAMLLLPKFIVR